MNAFIPRAGSLQRPCLAAFFLASAVNAQTAPTTRPTLDVQLEAIDAKTAQVEDLVADFEQKKFSSLLREPLITTGEVRSKSSTMLWIGKTPEPTRMRVTRERMQIFYVNQKFVEDYPIIGKLGALAASPLPRLSTLRERFTIEFDAGEGLDVSKENAEPVAFKLTPIEDEVKQYVGTIRVLLDASRGLVTTFELTDPDGERTTIAFTNIHINTGVEDASLELDAPRGTKTVKPLEPGK